MVDTAPEATAEAKEARFRELAEQGEQGLIAGDLDAAESAYGRMIQGSGFGERGDFYHGYGLEHLGVCMLLRAEIASIEDITPGEQWSEQDACFQEAQHYFSKAESLYAIAGDHARRASAMRYSGVVYSRWGGQPSTETMEDLVESVEYLSEYAGEIDDSDCADEHLGMSLAYLAECLAQRGWGRDQALALGHLRMALEFEQPNRYYAGEISRIAVELGIELPVKT